MSTAIPFLQDADSLEDVLRATLEELDVPDGKYAEAERAYGAVGEWLNADGSTLKSFAPQVYAQGSFALRTAIRPLGDLDYDVDAVCVLTMPDPSLTQQQLKALVGDRLKAHGKYSQMLEPPTGGRRCWTLRYADSSRFHLDLLPAIPDNPTLHVARGVPQALAVHALRITDSHLWARGDAWPVTNPKGYAEWFRSRTVIRLDSVRKTAGVERWPTKQEASVLHRAVQLLKRHRDVRFDDDDDKPISIIITTLAAWAYDGEEDVVEALASIVPKMRHGFEVRDGVPWVSNPVNPEENFADKWRESPRKQQLFAVWLDELENEFRGLRRSDSKVILASVRKNFDVRLDAWAAQHARPLGATIASTVEPVHFPPRTGRTVPSRFDVPHRQPPPWKMAVTSSIQITARQDVGGRYESFRSGDGPLRKHRGLEFEASANVHGHFRVFWQVVNTGREAALAGGLRGDIFEGTQTLRLLRREKTLYEGEHWVQCFIVKNGVCVAKSDEFVVRIGSQ